MSHTPFQGQPPQNKACAWCGNRKHQGYISVHIMKKRGCLAKNCRYLVPLKQHPYWQEREKKLSDKKTKKLMQRVEETIKHGTADEIADVFEEILERGFESGE